VSTHHGLASTGQKNDWVLRQWWRWSHGEPKGCKQRIKDQCPTFTNIGMKSLLRFDEVMKSVLPIQCGNLQIFFL